MSLPEFLDGFLGKILSMKSKFGNAMGQLKGMFGGDDIDLDTSMQDMEDLKRSMRLVRDLFRDTVQTEFIPVTIPMRMSISETKRLVEELKKERIPVRHLFVNQLQPQNDDCDFCSARHREHGANLREIQGSFPDLRIAQVQSFDREIRGVPALRAMGAQLFPSAGVETTDPEASSSTSSASSSDVKTTIRPPKSSSSTTPTVTAEIVE